MMSSILAVNVIVVIFGLLTNVRSLTMTQFNKYTESIGVAGGDVIFTNDASCSAVDCALSCQADDNCVMFTHNAAMTQCVTYSTTLLLSGPNVGTGTSLFMKPGLVLCPIDFSYYENYCYLVDPGPFRWSNAKARCEALQSNLVVIESSAENDFIYSLMLKKAVTRVWTSLTDVDVEGQFVWTTTLQQLQNYTNWWPGQPDDAGSNEDCVEIRTNWGDFKPRWNDERCTSSLGAACERVF